MKVAEKLKRIVDERGITYSSIAAKTGISTDSISRSFLGRRKLTADEMIAICKTARIDLSDLIDDNEKAS